VTRIRFLLQSGDRTAATSRETTAKHRARASNRQIRISPVPRDADNGDQLGVLTIDEAIAAANERGLDLVEVAPLARPPVVKIMDYGKFKFEQAKAGARREEKAARDSFERSEIPPRYRRSRFRFQDSACARVFGGRQQGEGDDDVPGPADGAHRARSRSLGIASRSS